MLSRAPMALSAFLFRAHRPPLGTVGPEILLPPPHLSLPDSDDRQPGFSKSAGPRRRSEFPQHSPIRICPMSKNPGTPHGKAGIAQREVCLI